MNPNERQHSNGDTEGTYVEGNTHEPSPSETVSDEASFAESSSTIESEWQREIELLRKQSDENHQRYLRAQADFENFRRRARSEKEDFLKYASLKIVEPLLSIMDNFERALISSKESKDFDALMKGLDMTYRQLSQIMEQEGVKPIEAVGKPFNPEFHEAVMQVESDDYEEGLIVEEIVKGYMMKDKVIRPSMVRVSV